MKVNLTTRRRYSAGLLTLAMLPASSLDETPPAQKQATKS